MYESNWISWVWNPRKNAIIARNRFVLATVIMIMGMIIRIIMVLLTVMMMMMMTMLMVIATNI